MPEDPHQDELLSAYLDGEVTDAQRREVEQWLESDPSVRQSLEELRMRTSRQVATRLEGGTPENVVNPEVLR